MTTRGSCSPAIQTADIASILPSSGHLALASTISNISTYLPPSIQNVKMSAQNSQGIQTLLNAEQEAQKIVQKARAYRVQRVKDARAEAQKEIEEYRQKKEEEFGRFEAEHSGINAQAERDAEREIEGKLAEIAQAGKKNRDQVIKDLIAAVTTIKPQPHVNSKPAQ
ncbi:H(+)-transporting V1 sector ATPase subunit G [Orbilia brochopaga]|uniref:V-type proton ATPase subunit G n=1 Tax=Orbilia brochopaga TaxID=3140254 RepID=A0AAV9UFS3_9PEZI